jgi:hypothetical protein
MLLWLLVFYTLIWNYNISVYISYPTYENSSSFFSVFSGHHTILVPPGDLEANPALWLTVVSQYKGITGNFFSIKLLVVFYCQFCYIGAICLLFSARYVLFLSSHGSLHKRSRSAHSNFKGKCDLWLRTKSIFPRDRESSGGNLPTLLFQ